MSRTCLLSTYSFIAMVTTALALAITPHARRVPVTASTCCGISNSSGTSVEQRWLLVLSVLWRNGQRRYHSIFSLLLRTCRWVNRELWAWIYYTLLTE
ncbi:hypothetical protein F5B20DRAFT_533316 [Whalleya microplaca]|nr:hypothetical protein F5B20DRAFT_533316 [Whalleya microplaca]